MYWTFEQYIEKAKEFKKKGKHELYFLCLTYAADEGNIAAAKQLLEEEYSSIDVGPSAILKTSPHFINLYRSRTESNTYSMYHLVNIYTLGQDSLNFIEGFKLCNELVEREFPPAMFELATFYSNGIVVEKDNNNSIFWAKQALLYGYRPAALRHLGHCYNRMGDMNKAKYYFKKAVKEGDITAIGCLGYVYAAHFEKRKKGIYMLEKAIDQGSVMAMVDLADFYRCEDDQQQAIKLLKQAIELGSSTAMFRLGQIYEWIKSEYKKAVSLYEKSANGGCFDSIKRLGKIYMTGEYMHDGIPRDPKKAVELYKMAVERYGYVSLEADLALAYGESNESLKALKLYFKIRHKGKGDCGLFYMGDNAEFCIKDPECDPAEYKDILFAMVDEFPEECPLIVTSVVRIIKQCSI